MAHSGIRLLLLDDPRFTLAATFDRARPAIVYLRQNRGCLVLLDLELPELDGLSALGEIVAKSLAPVIVLTGVTDPETLRQATRIGAQGVVCKGDPIDHVLEALNAVERGESYVSPCAAELMAEKEGAEITLTAKQSAVLQLLASGCTNKEIAYRLAISAPTVSFHLGEIRRKLGAGSSRQLVEAARSSGLLARSTT